MWTHLVALAVALLALVPVVGSSASFSADEGAAILQARSLAGGGGWIVEHPLPSVDPAGEHYPLENSERGPRGFAPFAKHPLYALLLAGAAQVAGVAGMVALSLAGTVAAAGLAAALAHRLDPALARPTVWVVGLASPLLFDGFLVMGHTLGAAATTGAVLAAVVALDGRRVGTTLAVVPLVALSVLLRNEAVFFAGALALVAGTLALRTKGGDRFTAGLVGAASALGGAGAHVLERLWVRDLLGGGSAAVAAPGAVGPEGFLEARLQALQITWLRPSYGTSRLVDITLLVMLAAIAVGAFALRRHPDHRLPVFAASILAPAAAWLALLSRPGTVIPGLLVAFPLALAGLLLVRRTSLQSTAARMAFWTFALFALAVLAIQYSRGGSGEWGGRYFALGIPVLVPVLLLVIREHRPRHRPASWAALAGLTLCSVAIAGMALTALHRTHQFAGGLISSIEEAGRAAAPQRPVMVTTSGTISRLAWRSFDEHRWLLSDPGELAGLLERMRAADIGRFALVTDDFGRDARHLAPSDEIVSSHQTEGLRTWRVLVVQLNR